MVFAVSGTDVANAAANMDSHKCSTRLPGSADRPCVVFPAADSDSDSDSEMLMWKMMDWDSDSDSDSDADSDASEAKWNKMTDAEKKKAMKQMYRKMAKVAFSHTRKPNTKKRNFSTVCTRNCGFLYSVSQCMHFAMRSYTGCPMSYALI
eukprot:1465105-Rhodomonas_salina.7